MIRWIFILPVGIWAEADPCSPEVADTAPTSPVVVFAPATADPYADNAAVDELNEAAWVWPR